MDYFGRRVCVLEEIEKAIKDLKVNGKRGFTQTVDLMVSLKGIDLKKPENKFSDDVSLPYGRGKDANIVVFSDNLKDLDCDILTSQDIQRFTTDKREARKLAVQTDFFFSEAPLMPSIGKSLGQILAPRGKMPKVLTGDVKKLIETYKKNVRIVVKNAPVIQCLVGKEDMEDRKLAENVEAVLKFLEMKLSRGRQNIGKVMVKLTMGKPVKIEVK
ncbi:MAG: 50S ribosomal protein L1 [Candidatus Aenigmarchaeota archaeon]|nr:50S ribosomal protein L1 [Candidatus Aenigmarchaeota archaeon]